MNTLNNYKAFHAFTKGHSHIEQNRDCEDYALSGHTDHCVYAITCDGHGGNPHFRSQIGAKICAEVIEKTLIEFSKKVNTEQSLKDELNINPLGILKNLTECILQTWLDEVDKDIKNTPFPIEDISSKEPRWKAVPQADKEIYRTSQSDDTSAEKYRAYGTTFKYACIMQDFYFCAQLGDGTICYYKNGTYTVADDLISMYLKNRPPHDKSTPSICTCSTRDDRFVCYDWKGKTDNSTPAMILCLTDGVDDARAMHIMADREYEQNEKPSDYLGIQSTLYFNFIKKQIIDTAKTLIEQKNNAKQQITETEISETLQKKLQNVCESNHRYHDDIGIAGIYCESFFADMESINE